MNLNKLNLIQIICWYCHTHRWKFMQFVEQMWTILTSHITAVNQQLSCWQI